MECVVYIVTNLANIVKMYTRAFEVQENNVNTVFNVS